jgi:hypothetical protein
MRPKAAPPTNRRQANLRNARANACFEQVPPGVGNFSVLIGVPLALPSTNVSVDWGKLAFELQSSLNTAFEPLGVSVLMRSAPATCLGLKTVSSSILSRWLKEPPELFCESTPLDERQTIVGPCVWVGRALASPENLSELSNLFFKVDAGIGRLLTRTNLRMEALIEEQGARARIFPVTAYWNSLSVSRLTHARLILRELARKNEQVVVQREGLTVVIRAQSGVITLDFPEETAMDLVGMLEPYGRTLGC